MELALVFVALVALILVGVFTLVCVAVVSALEWLSHWLGRRRRW